MTERGFTKMTDMFSHFIFTWPLVKSKFYYIYILFLKKKKKMKLGFVILHCLGPIISFENPFVLNWFFCFGLFHHGVCGLIMSAYTDYFGRKLLARVRPAISSE